MIKPVITFQDVGLIDSIKMLGKRIKGLEGAFVTIGVHEDAGKYTDGPNPPTVVEVALWNEFGTEHIPERSFLRSAIDDNEGTINQWRTEALNKILSGDWPVSKGLEMIGFRVQQLIQNKIKSSVPPPNAPSTVAAKQASGVLPGSLPAGGSTGTLIDTGLLLRSISFRVQLGEGGE